MSTLTKNISNRNRKLYQYPCQNRPINYAQAMLKKVMPKRRNDIRGDAERGAENDQEMINKHTKVEAELSVSKKICWNSFRTRPLSTPCSISVCMRNRACKRYTSEGVRLDLD